MSRLLTMIAAVVFAAPALAGEQPANLSKKIAPLVDAQTVAVAHVKLDKVDVGRLVQFVGKAMDLPAEEVAVAELAGKLIVTTLVSAGAKEVFLVVSLDGVPVEPVFAAIPVAGDEEGKKIASVLKLSLKLRDASEQTGPRELLVQPGKDFVLIGQANTLRRLRTLQPNLSPHLEKGLAAFPQADARLAVVLPDSLRRSLGELVPNLPKELSGSKTATLLNGVHFFSAGITQAPKFSAAATLRTDDAKTADAARALLVDLIGLAAKEIASHIADDKALPHLAKIVGLLTPSTDKNLLSWTWTEDEMIQAARPLAGQLKTNAGTAQSSNNLKQIGLAMHNYHDTHKQFPTGIRDKKNKLLLSWRVQVLPYIEGEQLYRKFKLDEPWDSGHNIKLVKQMPAVFRSPNAKGAVGKTTYVVPFGKGLFFDGAAPERKFNDITDGTSNTIMMLEVDDDHAATWTAPDDLNVDPKQSLKGVGGSAAQRFLALFADGTVRTMNRKIGPEEFYKRMTISGGEPTSNEP